jgi:hypothetical protein
VSTLILDRDQREALRHELEVEADAYGDFGIAFHNGDREYVVRHVERLRALVAVADAIGWLERSDAPDRQPVVDSVTVATWAKWAAGELAQALRETQPIDIDQDLDALGAMRVLAGERSS